MAVFGIIAEYNPFHNGHMYQIDVIRKSTDHAVVVVMSPNVVQRGDFAVLDKWTRTEVALLSGADLVLELPSPFALSTAERFAFGAVKTLEALGCVDYLCFGSESGDLQSLNTAAALVDDDRVSDRTKELLKEGMTYAKARSLAVEEINKGAAATLSTPNDILGVEYIRHIAKIGSKMSPYPILRKGSEHNGAEPCECFASASYLRENFNAENLKKYAPKGAFEIYEKALFEQNYSQGISSLENALLLKLRLMSAEEIANLPDVSEGLENRISRMAKEVKSLTELCELIKTRRYTMSRIRRILMYALLGFSKEIMALEPCYIRVLGHNKKGLELVSKKTATLPIITSLARAREISEDAKKITEIEEKCTAAFELTLKNKSSKNEFSTQIIRI
ncbi:MAG: nucleotidyltransferase [Oscillospiraceae bacterium]|nr:nucleotidyltransferase [Oscillospiraceae bacterium]